MFIMMNLVRIVSKNRGKVQNRLGCTISLKPHDFTCGSKAVCLKIVSESGSQA
jgi:hypothetical protein